MPLTGTERVSALAHDNTAMLAERHKDRFVGRGFGERTIKALIEAGVDMPERLLFMSEKQIVCMAGIGEGGSRRNSSIPRQSSFRRSRRVRLTGHLGSSAARAV